MIIPLYVAPETEKKSPEISMKIRNRPDAVLLTTELFETWSDELERMGKPEFHVFDTMAEAVAASRLIHSRGTNFFKLPSDFDVYQSPNGEGVLMIVNEDETLIYDDLTVHDHRTKGVLLEPIEGSWTLTQEQVAERSVIDPAYESHRALVISEKIGLIANKSLLRAVQIALETIPGAYVGFTSVSPEEIREDFRMENIDPSVISDSEIQSCLSRACAKQNNSDPLHEAIDATMERLKERFPSAFSDEGYEP